MALEIALLAYTKAQVTVVSNRVYALKAPQGVTEPYIVFNVISKNFIHSMDTDSGLTESVVRFSAVGATYKSAKETAEAIKTAYRNYVQGKDLFGSYMGSSEWVQATLLSGEADFYEVDTGRFYVDLDVIFWHKET